MPKSFVTYVRKTLKLKGRTRHSGRGSYMLFFDNKVTWPMMLKKFELLRDQLNSDHCLQKYKRTKDTIEIEADRKVFGSYNAVLVTKDGLRTLRFGKLVYKPCIIVEMTIDPKLFKGA